MNLNFEVASKVDINALFIDDGKKTLKYYSKKKKIRSFDNKKLFLRNLKAFQILLYIRAFEK